MILTIEKNGEKKELKDITDIHTTTIYNRSAGRLERRFLIGSNKSDELIETLELLSKTELDGDEYEDFKVTKEGIDCFDSKDKTIINISTREENLNEASVFLLIEYFDNPKEVS